MIARTILVVVVGLRALSLDAAPLHVRFIGNAAFEITDGDTSLLTDFPYQSGAFGYMEYQPETVAPQGAVLCLITHAHADHFEREPYAKTSWSILGPPGLTAGLNAARVIPFSEDIRFRSVRVQAFRTPHGEVEHSSYLVTWKTKKLYFTGDTDKLESLKGLKDIDVLFITPWLLRDAIERGTRLPGRKLVLHHHKADETLPACDKCLVPKQGETFEVD